MKCETAEELISALLDDELTEVQRTRVEKHVASCASCAQARTWLLGSRAAVRTLSLEQHELPPAFWPTLLRRLDAPQPVESSAAEGPFAAYPWLARIPARAAISVGMAVAAVGLALGIAWFTPMPENTARQGVPVAALVLDFEQQVAAAAPRQYTNRDPFSRTYPVGLTQPTDPHVNYVGCSTRYVNGVVAPQLRYSTGRYSMALYQLPVSETRRLAWGARAGQEFRVVSTERCCAVVWADGATAYALVSDLPPGALLGVAHDLAEAARGAPGA